MRLNQMLNQHRPAFFLPTVWGLLLLTTTYFILFVGAARLDLQGLQMEIKYWQQRRTALVLCKRHAEVGHKRFKAPKNVSLEEKLDAQGHFYYRVTFEKGERYCFYLGNYRSKAS